MSGQNKELVLVDHSDELIVDKDTYNGLLDTAGEVDALRAQVEELKENAKKAWKECHATSSELSKANQDRDMWRECAVYLDYRGADYCVAIHKELDGLQADNAEHREQMSRLLKNWKSRATSAEAELAECKHELSSLRNTLDDLVTIQRERAEKAEAERDALRERCEKLEWLVEVQEFYMYRLRNTGGWSTPGMERAKIGVAWQRRSAANDELRAMYMDALRAKVAELEN